MATPVREYADQRRPHCASHPNPTLSGCRDQLPILAGDDLSPGASSSLIRVVFLSVIVGQYGITWSVCGRASDVFGSSWRRSPLSMDTVTMDNGRAVSTTHGPGCVAVTGFSAADYGADPDLWFRMLYEEELPQTFKDRRGR